MGTYLSTPKTEKQTADGEGGRVRYGLASMQGWRTTMEDAHTAVPQLDESTSFFAVYDGHGGKAVSKFCAKHLHMQFLRNEAYSSGDLAASARKAFLSKAGWIGGLGPAAEREADGVSAEGNWTGPHSDFPGPTCGSTACVAIVRNNQLVVANAGDSRCVISTKGRAHDLSTDHKPELESERQRIQNAGGYIVAGRVNGSLNLTRAIGDMEMKENKLLPAEKQTVSAEPEVKTVTLSEDDEFIVLACDGIWDCMTSQQVVDFLHEKLNTEDSLSAVCEKLLDRCLAPESGGEGCDNMTVILVAHKKPAATSSSEEQSAVTTEEVQASYSVASALDSSGGSAALTMSEVFEGCERQYSEISVALSRKCAAASALDGEKQQKLSEIQADVKGEVKRVSARIAQANRSALLDLESAMSDKLSLHDVDDNVGKTKKIGKSNKLGIRKENVKNENAGVRFTTSGKFQAYYYVKKKQYTIGTFRTLDEAVEIRDRCMQNVSRGEMKKKLVLQQIVQGPFLKERSLKSRELERTI